jgi:hypothetical protein
MDEYGLTDLPPDPFPLSAMKEYATGLHELKTAYVEAGFTNAEAMDLIKEMIRGIAAGRRPRAYGGGL